MDKLVLYIYKKKNTSTVVLFVRWLSPFPSQILADLLAFCFIYFFYFVKIYKY